LNVKDRNHIIDLDVEEEMLLNMIIQQYVNRITVRAAVRLIETVIIVQQPPIFILPPFSNTSTWPEFHYVSMDTSLDQQYENSCYISCRKYSQDWCYGHHADIYSWRFFFGFF